MPSVSFTDAIGLATITAGVPRLNGWMPGYEYIGEVDEELGTGATHSWEFRHDHIAEFTVDEIHPSEFAKLQRVKAHLIAGGQVTVTTDDRGARVYTCIRAPGAMPSWEWVPEAMRFRLRLAVKNTADTPMLCVYPA